MRYLKLILLTATKYPTRDTILLVRDFLITFDSKYYRIQVGSVLGFLLPRLHFLFLGHRKLISPSRFFDAHEYSNQGPTSIARKRLPFLHYLKTSSGIVPATIWDYAYLEYAPEARRYDRNLLVHLKMHGSTQAFSDFFSPRILTGELVIPLNLKTKVVNAFFSEINPDFQSRDELVIEISNCCKSVVSGFDDWLTEMNMKVSVCRNSHKHDLDFKSEDPKVEFRGSHDLFIEAHQPIWLDVPSMAQILLSKHESESKLKCLKSLIEMQTPKSRYFNTADYFNFSSFQLLERDLNLMLLEMSTIEKVIVRTQRHQLKPIRNILIFSHEDSRTGGPIYALQVAQSLLQNGYDVQVVSLRDNFRNGNFDALGNRHSYLSDHISFGYSGSDTITNWLLTENGNQAMRNLMTKFNPDLILANSLASCEAIRFASAASIPSILYVHEAWDIEIVKDTTLDPFALRVRDSLEAAPLVLFGSNATLEHWKKTKLAINGRVAQSYRKINTYTEAEKRSAKADLKQHLGLTSSDIIFLSVATFEPRKRIEDIVHSFKSIQDPRINLILLGSIEGPTHTRIEKLVDGDLRIRLVSPTSNLAPYYAAADCLVFASEEETMPLVLQEAALWEIPRIVSKYLGYQELIPSPKLALLFNPKDIEGMAMQMLRFLNDGVDTRVLVKNALSQQLYFMESGMTELISGIDSLAQNWISVVPEGWLDEKN